MGFTLGKSENMARKKFTFNSLMAAMNKNYDDWVNKKITERTRIKRNEIFKIEWNILMRNQTRKPASKYKRLREK